MVIFSNKMETLLVCLLLNVALPLAREVTIYPDGETDPDFRSHGNKPQSVFDVRKTTFFNIERTVPIDTEGDEEPYLSDEYGVSNEIDVFAWRSVQRVVFTLTNPVDTH